MSTPEIIYLIHGEYEGENCMVWCDDPAPSSYSDPDDAVKYVRADTLPLPVLPPFPPEGEGMPRYGLQLNGPESPVTVLMDDGFWTPWHLASAEVERLQARVAELEKSFKELSAFFNDKIVGEQSAYIEWQHGRGAVAGMHWISNGLCGPGLIPDDDEPWGKEAQAYFNANKSDPFPVCSCGRPSGQLWMGHGACSDKHMAEIKSNEAAKAGGDL